MYIAVVTFHMDVDFCINIYVENAAFVMYVLIKYAIKSMSGILCLILCIIA